jgi:hypothetical protein
VTISGDQLAGLGVIAALMLCVGFIALRAQPRAIKLFAAALCAVGLGYLATTPAPRLIVRSIFGHLF